MIKENLILIHSGILAERVKGTFMLALLSSPFAVIGDHIYDWYFNNFGYFYFVMAAIMIDHILGSCVHAFIKKDFCFKKNIIGLLVKGSLVLAVGILVEGMATIIKDTGVLIESFGVITKLMVFIYPAGSAFVNCSIITGGIFPPIGFMKKINNFNKNLKHDEDIEQGDSPDKET